MPREDVLTWIILIERLRTRVCIECNGYIESTCMSVHVHGFHIYICLSSICFIPQFEIISPHGNRNLCTNSRTINKESWQGPEKCENYISEAREIIICEKMSVKATFMLCMLLHMILHNSMQWCYTGTALLKGLDSRLVNCDFMLNMPIVHTQTTFRSI